MTSQHSSRISYPSSKNDPWIAHTSSRLSRFSFDDDNDRRSIIPSILLLEPCVALSRAYDAQPCQNCSRQCSVETEWLHAPYPSAVNLPYYLLVSTLNMSCTRNYSLILFWFYSHVRRHHSLRFCDRPIQSLTRNFGGFNGDATRLYGKVIATEDASQRFTNDTRSE
jgi:hypothetical protein